MTMAPPRRSSSTLQEPVKDGDDGASREPEAPEAAHQPPVRSERSLPAEKSKPAHDLENKTVFIYGPPKIGKSTLASQFGGGEVFFFDTEGGLSDLEVYKEPVTDWLSFLEWCAAVAKTPTRYKATCIDTFDMLASYCSAYSNAKLGIAHESEAEWGRGWSAVRNELQRPLAKLAALPGGLILLGHSQDVEIKTRNAVITKAVPTLGKAAREIALNMSDLILFCDFAPDEDGVEQRVMRTKPAPYWEAGERGNPPRLPDVLPMTYAALEEAWKGGQRGLG